jgi:PKHD-type hydroxylase
VNIVLTDVLSADDIDRIKELIASERFVDGRATSVLTAKKNLQLPVDSRAAREAGDLVCARLQSHETFNLAVHPFLVHPPLFSLYEPGMEYPDHVDAALMGGLRTDVAVTLFLSERSTYDGGELVVDTGNGIRRYALEAGDAIAYPASTIHHVAEVTRGARLAAVLWVQSTVRDPAKREVLYNLAVAMRNLADTACGPRLNRSYWNLLRLWAETAAGPTAA